MLPVTTGSILLGLALLIVVALFLVRPFFKAAPANSAPSGRRQELLVQKAALLDAVRSLDFDHDTGKLPDEEYEQQRAFLMNEAAETLKALDSMTADSESADVYAQIEAAISGIKAQSAAGQKGGGAAHFCARCGHGLDSNDKFCANCGQPVYGVQLSLEA
jgi:zinc-ribbon domain